MCWKRRWQCALVRRIVAPKKNAGLSHCQASESAGDVTLKPEPAHLLQVDGFTEGQRVPLLLRNDNRWCSQWSAANWRRTRRRCPRSCAVLAHWGRRWFFAHFLWQSCCDCAMSVIHHQKTKSDALSFPEPPFISGSGLLHRRQGLLSCDVQRLKTMQV